MDNSRSRVQDYEERCYRNNRVVRQSQSRRQTTSPQETVPRFEQELDCSVVRGLFGVQEP